MGSLASHSPWGHREPDMTEQQQSLLNIDVEHQGNQNRKRHTYLNVHCSTVYNSQDMEATQRSISRRMGKKAVVHIHNGIWLSCKKKNAFESVLMRWMKLEPIIQSEVSQKEKHQYSILTHIYMEFRKMVIMTLYVRQQKRHRCIEQSLGLCGRRRGWDDLREQH